jgi:F-type H+/Na+-transporting ATPase subunit alpha
VAIVFAATNGYLDPVPVEKLRAYEDGLYTFLEMRHAGVLTSIAEKKILDDDVKKALAAALDDYSASLAAGLTAA